VSLLPTKKIGKNNPKAGTQYGYGRVPHNAKADDTGAGQGKRNPQLAGCVEFGVFSLKFLDNYNQKEYKYTKYSGGKAMLNRIDRFNNVIVMQSAVPAYYWQNNGLTLLYPFSNN
jgi:hypothetical protein